MSRVHITKVEMKEPLKSNTLRCQLNKTDIKIFYQQQRQSKKKKKKGKEIKAA